MKKFDKILDTISIITTIIFFLAVIVMVLVQAFGIITLNGALTVAISDAIAESASMVSALTAVISIILAYIRGQMKQV